MLCFTATECSLCFQPPRSRRCIYENIEQKYTPDITQLRKFERWLPGLYSLPPFFLCVPIFRPSTISSYFADRPTFATKTKQRRIIFFFFSKINGQYLSILQTCFQTSRANLVTKMQQLYKHAEQVIRQLTWPTYAIHWVKIV